MKRITPYCLSSLLLTSACSTNTNLAHSPSLLPLDVSAPLDDRIENYARDIKSAIQLKFFLADEYIGKECDVSSTMSKEGVIGDDLQAEGYQPLCAAALNAIRKANIPPAPDNETYEFFKKLNVDFRPQ